MTDTPRPTPEQLRRYAEQFNQSLSMRHFGARVSFPSADRAQVELEIRPEHRGGLGSDAVNGGVLAAMFDLVVGVAPALVDPTRRTATMQLSMSFMQPVRGSRLRAVSQIDRAGGQVLFVSAAIYDEQERPCARCQGVVRMSQLKWQSGESPAVN